MWQYRRLVFVVLWLLSFGFQATAQLDNTGLTLLPPPPDSLALGGFSVQLEHLNYLRNNEYFLPIADGYTLFGYQLIPKVVYRVNSHLFLEAGAFIRKDYGQPGFKEVEPVFTARFKKGRSQLILGNLDGGLEHGLIEPLYNFENQLNSRMELGNQWKYSGRFSQLDAWVDWRHMIYDYSPVQEEVWGGFSGRTTLFSTPKTADTLKHGFGIRFPYQFTGYHKGGQIDTANLPLTTYFNGAAGLELEWLPRKNSVFQRIVFQPYFVGFVDYSFTKQLPFTSGSAFYLNLSAKTRWLECMVSYWNGSNFTSWNGGKLYRSLSSSVKNPGYAEPNRELLIIRFFQELEVLNNIYISARLEPYLDLRAKTWEFSHGLFLSYRGQIWKSPSN